MNKALKGEIGFGTYEMLLKNLNENKEQVINASKVLSDYDIEPKVIKKI